MGEVPNRTELSALAKRALSIEAATLGKSEKDLASELILRGISDISMNLAQKALGIKDENEARIIFPEARLTDETTSRTFVSIDDDVPTQNEIKRLLAEGKSGREIAKILGRPKSTVNKWIKEHKI